MPPRPGWITAGGAGLGGHGTGAEGGCGRQCLARGWPTDPRQIAELQGPGTPLHPRGHACTSHFAPFMIQ